MKLDRPVTPNRVLVIVVPLLTGVVVVGVGGASALIVFASVTVAALGFALPLLKRRQEWRYGREVTHRSELVADRDAVLRAMKDIEGEFENGKIDAAEYERLRAGLKDQAIELTLEVRADERALREAREAVAAELAEESRS